MGNTTPNTSGILSPNTGSETTAKLEQVNRVLESTKLSSSRAAIAYKTLDNALKKAESSTKLSNKTVSIYSQTLQKLSAAHRDTTVAAKVLARELSDGQTVMSDVARAEHDSNLTGIKIAQDSLKANNEKGKSERSLAILSNQRRRMELESFKDTMETYRETALQRAADSSGIKKAGALASATQYQFAKYGAEAASTVGGALGITGGSMAKLAVAAGGAGLAFMALKYLLERVSQGAIDASKSGMALGNSWSDAKAIGATYNQSLTQIGSAAGISQEALQQLVDVGQENYILSLFAIGDAYEKTVNSSDSARSAIILQSMEYSARIANIGRALGLSADDSVKYAAQMGAIGRSSSASSEAAFGSIASEAKRLQLRFTDLYTPMMLLAEASAAAGKEITTAASETMLMTSAIQNLQKRGLRGFSNLNSEALAKFSSKFTQFLMSIEDTRLAAFTYKRGEGFYNLVDRVAYDQTGTDRVSALGDMFKRMGINPNSAAPQDAFKAGIFMGSNPNNFRESMEMGRMGMSSVNSGWNAEKMFAQTSAMINSRYDAAATVGSNLAKGSDVMGTLTNYVKAIMDVVVWWGATAGSKKASDLQRDIERNDKAMAAEKSEYGKSAGNPNVNKNLPNRSRTGAL
jgi:hypothetical protein